MCRNITVLRGLEPEATSLEIDAAALQYVRKVGGLSSVSARNEEAVQRAVNKIAAATSEPLATLPPRQRAPRSTPPSRRHGPNVI